MLKHISKTVIERDHVVYTVRRGSDGSCVKYKCFVRNRNMDQRIQTKRRGRQSLSWPNSAVESKVYPQENIFLFL